MDDAEKVLKEQTAAEQAENAVEHGEKPKKETKDSKDAKGRKKPHPGGGLLVFFWGVVGKVFCDVFGDFGLLFGVDWLEKKAERRSGSFKPKFAKN